MLQTRLDDFLDMSHPLILLAGLIDWEAIERDHPEHFPSHTGRPATRVRLAVGLLYLQHTFKLSDRSVLAQWIQNPYFQVFCGEGFMQHVPPVGSVLPFALAQDAREAWRIAAARRHHRSWRAGRPSEPEKS